MDWSELLSGNGSGLLIASALVAEFFRRLNKGDLVLGREYGYLKNEVDRCTSRDKDTYNRVEETLSEIDASLQEMAERLSLLQPPASSDAIPEHNGVGTISPHITEGRSMRGNV
jgi:hypothetical protein